jgi:PKD repeat protein
MQIPKFVIIALVMAIVASTGFTALASSAEPLSASFSSDVTTGAAPLTVHFMDRSTGSPTGWQWSFGDDTSSTRQDPTHTFQTPGTYTVALTVSDGYESSTTSTEIIVTSATATPQPIRIVPVPVHPIHPGDRPARPIDKQPDTVKKPDLIKKPAPVKKPDTVKKPDVKKPGKGKPGSDRGNTDNPIHHFN